MHRFSDGDEETIAACDEFEELLGCCSGWQGQSLLLFFTSRFNKWAGYVRLKIEKCQHELLATSVASAALN